VTSAFALPADGGDGLPFLSAVLLALAFPPFHLLLPSFVALVPLALWLRRLPRGREGGRVALRGGFRAGLLFHALLFHWMLVALLPRTALAVPGFLVAVLLLSGLWAAVAAGVQGAREAGCPVWLGLPVFWTAAEWVRAHLGDLSFPWMQLGESLTGWPRLIGAAELVGARGLSFWMALVAGLLAAAVGRREGGPRLRWRPLAAAVLVAAAPILYSLEQWEALETRPVARVTVLQPDLPPEVKAQPRLAVERTVRWTEELLGTVGSGAGSSGVDGAGRPSMDPGRGRPDPSLRDTGLLVFPETAFPVVPGSAMAPAGGSRIPLERWIRRLAGRVGAPVLYGALGSVGGAGNGRLNAAFYRTPPAAGAGDGRYGKRRLVPGFEQVPFLEAAPVRRMLPGAAGSTASRFRRGTTAPLFRAGDGRFGVLICYESIFGDLARDYRRRGAGFLVNITNDGWFGTAEPAWRRTAALWQHPAHLVMRAVENRVGIVRAANNGISGIVDPRGRWTRRSGLFRPEALAGEVRSGVAPTPFARFGDLAGPLAALAAAGVTLAATARRRARSGMVPTGEGDGEPGPASTIGIEPREEP